MKSKITQKIDEYVSEETMDTRQLQFNAYKAKQAVREQRKLLQRRLFGEHFNYQRVGINKDKKYLLEEQRNTEIERSNRILLQKIQRIAKRSRPSEPRKRTYTDHLEIGQNLQKIDYFNPKRFQSIDKSAPRLLKDNSSSSNSSKAHSKILFAGQLQHQGKIIPVKAYLQNSKYIISADIDKIKQLIYIDIDSYRELFVGPLDTDHSKIVEHLQFNGQLLQLIGVREQNVKVQEHQQFVLPRINNKTISKTTENKTPRNIQFLQ